VETPNSSLDHFFTRSDQPAAPDGRAQERMVNRGKKHYQIKRGENKKKQNGESKKRPLKKRRRAPKRAGALHTTFELGVPSKDWYRS